MDRLVNPPMSHAAELVKSQTCFHRQIAQPVAGRQFKPTASPTSSPATELVKSRTLSYRHIGQADAGKQFKLGMNRATNPTLSNATELDDDCIRVAPEVQHALKHGQPVVALESTIISHGMPYPQNYETAKEVEEIIRRNGAVPATVAILDGVPCIGLTDEQLKRLALLGQKVHKTSRRDIAQIVAFCENGATTVSATMFFAHMVGIAVFVTGGIGGVHRYGEQTMDISSDLTELGRTPVAVVSAGIKSILDIPRTLEYLETQGVTVAAYRTDEFPAFFTASSGCKVLCRLADPDECAKLIYANRCLGLGSGMLIAVPIPRELAVSGQSTESAIQTALKEAKDRNISGSAATPFLLSRVNELTGGASLAANIELVKNNAQVGAKIAVALASLAMARNGSTVRSML